MEEKTSVYEIAFECEILTEVAWSLHARLFHYMDRNNIDEEDKDNIVVMLSEDAGVLINMITHKCRTLDELKIVEGRLQQIRCIIERLENNET